MEMDLEREEEAKVDCGSCLIELRRVELHKSKQGPVEGTSEGFDVRVARDTVGTVFPQNWTKQRNEMRFGERGFGAEKAPLNVRLCSILDEQDYTRSCRLWNLSIALSLTLNNL